MEKCTMTEIKEDENLFESIKEKVKLRFLDYKKKDMLIINRFGSPNFAEVFKDSLYAYENGTVLLERFYIKDNCESLDVERNVVSDEGKKLIDEFASYTDSIPPTSELTEEELNAHNDKINEYQESIKNIPMESTTINIFQKDNMQLLELSKSEDEFINRLAELVTSLYFSMINTLFWEPLDDKIIAITGIEYPGYVDVVATIMTGESVEEREDDIEPESTDEDVKVEDTDDIKTF